MKPYHKITLSYLTFGIVWIAITDTIALLSTPHIHAFASVGIIKGWFYVILSAWVIFYLTKSAFQRHEAAVNEKAKVFHSTVSGAHHVLLNYLNQMQLVTMEAERVEGFDKNILELSRSLSKEAAEELKRIGEIKEITSESINSEVYRDRRR